MLHRAKTARRIERARFLIDQNARWIVHADAKVAILAAFIGAISVGVASQAASVGDALTNPFARWPLIIFLAVWVASLTKVCLFVHEALTPRVAPNQRINSYSWPDQALHDALPPFSNCRDAEQAEDQVRLLSRIAASKFWHFSRALRYTWVFVITSGLVIALVSAAGAGVYGRGS